MGVYKSTSCKEIIGRVLRNTRMTDLTYADSIIEWIGEASGRLMIRSKLNHGIYQVTTENHSARLPCGLVKIDAVFYNNQRLRYGSSDTDPRITAWNLVGFQKEFQEVNSLFIKQTSIGTTQASDNNSEFYTNIQSGDQLVNTNALNQNALNYIQIRGLDLKLMTSINSNDYYIVQLDYIKTSFSIGTIILFYKYAPVDIEGYPLIPDLEEAKQGIFWYIMGNLSMAGYQHNDPRMNYEFCEERAEKFFRKAKNIIKTPSLDQKESQVNLWNNLIPPSNYYETFFSNAEQRKFVIK